MDNDTPYNPKGTKKKARKSTKKKMSTAKTMPNEMRLKPFTKEYHEVELFKKNTKGQRKVRCQGRVAPGSYILLYAEGTTDMDSVNSDLELWLAQVEGLFYDPMDEAVWFKIRYFWARDDVEDRILELGRDSCEQTDALNHLSINWERPLSAQSHYDWVTEDCIAAKLSDNEVRLFDERALHPGIIPHNKFYWRCTFNQFNGELKYPSGRSLCALKSCKSRDYQLKPTDGCSQVFCANSRCMRWMHAKCLRSNTNRDVNPGNLSREAHDERRMLSTPLAHKSQPAFIEDAALGALTDTERKMLINLAGAPIVRPTFISISGNIDDVLTARNWIYVALVGQLDDESLEGLRGWLRTFTLEGTKNDWHEAILRAQGTVAGEIRSKMQLAKDGKLTIGFDVCLKCGTPV